MWLPHHSPAPVRERQSARTHDVADAPPPDRHLQRYGRVAWCVHGRRLRLHREERYGVSHSYKGKLVRERQSARTHDMSAAPPPDLHLLFNEVCHGAWQSNEKKNSQPTNQPTNQPPNQPPTQHPLQRCRSGVEHDERNDPWVQTPISFWILSPSNEQQLVGMKPSCREASLVLSTTSATIPCSKLRSDLEPCFP